MPENKMSDHDKLLLIKSLAELNLAWVKQMDELNISGVLAESILDVISD